MNHIIHDTIIEYLVADCGLKPDYAETVYDTFERHPDILHDLYHYARSKSFRPNNAVCIQEMTARRLARDSHLTVLGAFTFLLHLRESPEEAMQTLEEGLIYRRQPDKE